MAWVKSICVVTFHEDLGQQVEGQFPEVLDSKEQRSLAFLAFPDSNSFNTMGDLTFVFKLKIKDGSVYGYTFFRQKRDPSKPRGFFQKSVVVLSELPYISLFRQVAEIVGPLYFDHGQSLFEVAANCFNTWGEIEPGANLELPMLGNVINFTVPATDLQTNHEPSGDGLSELLESENQGYPGMFQDINIYEVMGQGLVHLWGMWEILISGENLMIMSDSPGSCSMMVLGLLSLISPLNYEGDFCPYYTIFDQDPSCPKIIGVTNPFFLKSMENYNVYQFESRNGDLEVVNTQTKHSLSISSVKTLISQIHQRGSREANAINNSMIKRHFRELTLALLAPFEQYFRVNASEIQRNPYERPVAFKSFKDSGFLKELNNSRVVFPLLKFTSRPKAIQLYAKFIQTSTFRIWFARQRQRANEAAHELFMQAIANYDVKAILPTLDPPGMRRLYKRIESQLQYEENRGCSQAVDNLKKQLSELISAMTGSSREDIAKVILI